MLKAKVLLDRSGSMVTNWVETIGSINGYVEGLNKSNTDAEVSVVAFDTTEPYVVLREPQNALHWENMTPDIATPRGGTPLFDALGRMLGETTGDKVVIVVVTDGQENSSKEFTGETIKRAIKAAEAKDWQIIFLSADLNFDASHYTATFAMADSSFVNTSNATRGATMDSLSAKSAGYASASPGEGKIGFTKEEQKKAEEK